MSDEIELHWTLKVDYTFEKYALFEALVNLCLAYYGDIPEEYDYAEFIIIWLKDNLKIIKKNFFLYQILKQTLKVRLVMIILLNYQIMKNL